MSLITNPTPNTHPLLPNHTSTSPVMPDGRLYVWTFHTFNGLTNVEAYAGTFVGTESAAYDYAERLMRGWHNPLQANYTRGRRVRLSYGS